MTDLFENPAGLCGFEFIEFAGPEPEKVAAVFELLGFTRVAVHRSKQVDLYRQGGINFILNRVCFNNQWCRNYFLLNVPD